MAHGVKPTQRDELDSGHRQLSAHWAQQNALQSGQLIQVQPTEKGPEADASSPAEDEQPEHEAERDEDPEQ
jgi:hypothetical protein